MRSVSACSAWSSPATWGGTRCYDELAIGVLALLGARPGLFVDRMWVGDRGSVAGGRGIWDPPKHFAEFAWDGRVVRITEGMGLVAAATVDDRIGGFDPARVMTGP